jgi:hypothetical protein
VARALELGPVRWLGTRSYGLYLWHWPIFVFTQPGLDLPLDEPAATVVRLAIVVALTEASYRFVEVPLRRRRAAPAIGESESTAPGLDAPAAGGAPSSGLFRRPAMRLAGGLVAAAFLAPLLVTVAIAQPPAPPDELVVGAVDGLITGGDEEPVVGPPVPDDLTTPGASPDPASPSAGPGGPDDPPIFAVGESVLVGAAKPIAREIGPMVVDAKIGRHVTAAIDVLRRRAEAGLLGRVVIMHIGNNGPMRREDAEEAMEILRDVPIVVWINVRVPRSWEQHNNEVIEALPLRYANARVVDWHAASAGRRGLLARDGVHLSANGYPVLARLVREALEAF